MKNYITVAIFFSFAIIILITSVFNKKPDTQKTNINPLPDISAQPTITESKNASNSSQPISPSPTKLHYSITGINREDEEEEDD